MTDRELLEAAARAAGLPFAGENYLAPGEIPDLGDGWGMVTGLGPTFWNPLTDDGDALRLAVKLCLCVDAGASMWWGEVTYISGQYWKRLGCTGFGEETHGDDPMGATRRAIVRAAATMAP